MPGIVLTMGQTEIIDTLALRALEFPDEPENWWMTTAEITASLIKRDQRIGSDASSVSNALLKLRTRKRYPFIEMQQRWETRNSKKAYLLYVHRILRETLREATKQNGATA